ncbi:MAG TPA: DUF3343 domain-containing protein [Longimicrobiales bacterium]|nr:DUF3343 domain-containing protein [Longimicrobiales bacterium]
MSESAPVTVLLVFDSSNAVLWAEEVAEDVGVPVEVVPAPAESRAKCDLALIASEAVASKLETALTEEGVPFRRWI